MPGLGTIINCIAILLGGLCGLLFGRFVKKQLQDSLIFCVGVNLIWGKKIRVANMLPAIVLAVVAAFVPL